MSAQSCRKDQTAAREVGGGDWAGQGRSVETHTHTHTENDFQVHGNKWLFLKAWVGGLERNM